MAINTNNVRNYEKPSTGAIIGGVAAGSAVQSLAMVPHRIIAPKAMQGIAKLSSSLTTDEFSKVEKAITDTLQLSGLDKKGVSIIKATTENSAKISEIMSKEVDSGILKYLPKKAKEFFGRMFSSQIKSGQNACYTFASKKIVMPENKLGLAVFHEMGHAMNANFSKFGKILQKCRPMTLLALPIAAIALFKTKKAPGEEPKNGLDKATTFIKNNAGKLTFATFLPTLLEEGLATAKGNKFAKQLLSPDLAKKVAKTNALGFSTYLLAATLSGIGIYLGTKVKDHIAHNKIADKNT